MREGATSTQLPPSQPPASRRVSRRDAFPHDAVAILSGLWQRGREELAALGVDPVSFVVGFEARAKRRDAVTYLYGGDPVAILGWETEAPGVVHTHFQATHDFERDGVGLAITRAMREDISWLALREGVHTINTFSLCIDERAAPWFRSLGLREDKAFDGPVICGRRLRKFTRRF